MADIDAATIGCEATMISCETMMGGYETAMLLRRFGFFIERWAVFDARAVDVRCCLETMAIIIMSGAY